MLIFFQLVVSQKKTGVLSLRDKNQVVELHLQEGCILACQDDSRPRDKKLGQLLVRGGFISEEECAHALALQDTKGRRLGELIVAQGLLELVTVRSLAEVQVFETVFEVFSLGVKVSTNFGMKALSMDRLVCGCWVKKFYLKV